MTLSVFIVSEVDVRTVDGPSGGANLVLETRERDSVWETKPLQGMDAAVRLGSPGSRSWASLRLVH